MNQPYASGIDYLAQSAKLIGRPGKAYNIVTGCRHGLDVCACANDCWARKCATTRLRDNPGYPYGFEPTFHPERVKAVGVRSEWLIFLNCMGDVGGNWDWRTPDPAELFNSEYLANQILQFAALNPRHILLLLTKNPAWYGLVEWPDNVWCGFSATNNAELYMRGLQFIRSGQSWDRAWMSLEPWLDNAAPDLKGPTNRWTVIGGLSGANRRPVSDATWKWLQDETVQARRFTKRNAYLPQWLYGSNYPAVFPREYPESWRVEK